MKRITLLITTFIFALIFRMSALMAQPVNGLIAHFPMNDKYDVEFTEHQFYGLEHNNEKGADREGNPQCALYFDGISKFVKDNSGPFSISSNSEKTVALWYKSYIDFESGLLTTLFSNSNDYGLYTYDLYKPIWAVKGGYIWYDEGEGFVADTNWHHLAGVYDHQELSFYYDGQLVETQQIEEFISTSGKITIGDYLHGLIDDIYVYDRALGSSEILELYYASSSCGTSEPQSEVLITGTLFNDFDGNNIFDGADFYLDNFNLEFQPSDINSITNQFGSFSQLLDSGTIQTLTIPIDNQDDFSFSIAQNPIDLNNYTEDTLNLGLIGLKPIEKIYLASFNTSFPATIAHSRNAECNVVLNNDGNVIMNGNLNVTISGQQLFTKFVFPANHSEVTINDSTTKYIYTVNNLIPLDSLITGFTIFSQAPVNSKINISYEYVDVSGYTISGSYVVTVVAPHDPNYIAVDHEKIYKQFITDFNQLAYTVHFQNMGNAPAENVVIRQIVPKELKSDYIYVIGASSAMQLQKVNNGNNTELVWTFDNINLSPASEDSISSTGYVSFSMFPESLEKDDSIILEADIYFDSQPAINTNEAITSLICKGVAGVNMVDFTTFDALCFGDQTGGILMKTNLDTTGLLIRFNGENAIPFTNDSFNHSAGNFVITTVDELGCTQSQAISIKQPAKLNSSIIDNGNGQKEFLIGGGTPPYQIKWGNGYTGYELDNLPDGMNTYVITDANGCELQGVYEKIVLSHQDVKNPIPLVFPNPVKDFINVIWMNKSFELELFEISGRKVTAKHSNTDKCIIDLSVLPSQIYVLKLTAQDGETKYFRIVKI